MIIIQNDNSAHTISGMTTHDWLFEQVPEEIEEEIPQEILNQETGEITTIMVKQLKTIMVEKPKALPEGVKFVVDEDSIIGKKILDANLIFDPVINNKGELIDIIQKKIEIPIEEIRKKKIDIINASCQAKIHSGIDIKTSDGTYHFNASDQDQTNMLAYRAEMMASISGLPSQVKREEGIWYKSDDVEATHRFWSFEDFQKITDEIFKYKVYELTYCDNLKQYIRSLSDPDKIKAISYGMDLSKGV